MTTCKDAIKMWEEKSGEKAAESKKVELWCQYPPIAKMDAALNSLVACEHLSLSTNSIDKIGNLSGLKNIKILSLGRNNIKKLENLDPLADTLEELWLSYCQIEKLTGISALRKLRVLYLSNNKVSSWTEFEKLAELPALEDLLLTGTPLEEKHSKEGDWRKLCIKILPNLKRLDGRPIGPEEKDEALNS